MKRILLVEPHPDDVCLGFLYSVKRKEADYHLISVSSHNGRDSKKFCEGMGIEWHSTKWVDDIPYQKYRISPHEIRKRRCPYSYQRIYYLEQHEEEYLKIEKLIAKAVEEIGCDVVVTTLGILHPVHVLVSIACQTIARELGKELIYFADFPYASRKFGEKIIKDSGMKYSLVHGESLEIRKDKLLEQYYPTETNILRWDRSVISDSPEMIFQKEKRKKSEKDRPIKVSVIFRGGKYVTGAHRHATYMIKALQKVGVDAKLVDFGDLGDPDILVFEAVGTAFEDEIRADGGKKRLGKIVEYMGKIPFVLIRHSIFDRSVFKRSFSFFEDFVWDLVVSVNDSVDMLSLIREENKLKKLVHIDHPFEFDDRRFADRSEYGNIILCPARIASCKRTHLIFEIAKMLHGKRKFLIAGREDGIYWYRQIKDHPDRGYVTFVGEYEDVASLYQNSAFAIDMAYLYRHEQVQKSKQFTLLESIDCGNMPIIFDSYQYEGGFSAVWLPLPERKGNRIIFDTERYAEIIGNSKYDFGVVKESRELLKKEHDLEKIGNQYKEEFRRLLR